MKREEEKVKKARRIAAFLLALVLVIGLLPLDALTVQAAGAGSVTEISNFADLTWALKEDNTATIKLTKDIEVSNKFAEGEFPKEVNGTKVLDLNGHEILVTDKAQYGDASVYKESLFKVNGDLTVEDSSGEDSLIHFNAYAYYQAKTVSDLDGGEYSKKDERAVFEVMDGGKLVINGGTIQAGRCKTQYITGGYKTWNPSVQWTDTFHGNATFVISGSAVILHAGATFIMNGGELNGRGVPLIYTGFKSTDGKQTVLHINDGYFYGKAGADILTSYSMKELIGNEDEAFDLQIRGGVFETDKEDYEREIDNSSHKYYGGLSDSVVSKGVKGDLNIPESCVVGMYRNKRTKDTADRYDNLVNGKTYNHFDLSEDQLENVNNGTYLLLDMKLTVRPKASVTAGDIAYSKENKFGAFCVDEEVTLSYDGYIPLWPVEEVGNVTDEIDSPVGHAISYKWRFSRDGKSYELFTAGPSLELCKLKTLKEELYNEMVADKERWDITLTVNEYYQGSHSYAVNTSAKERSLAIRDHSFMNSGANTAGCTYNGRQEQTCYFCGVTRTVTTEPLGHIFDETDWYPFDLTYHAHVCKRCGEAVGGSLERHTFAIVPNSTVIANCQHAGKHEEYCTVCGYRKTIVDSAKLAHNYKNTGYATDYEKNGNGHWKVCQRCHEVGPMEDHVDGNGDGICDKCGTAIPVIFVSTVGHVAPSFHSTLEVSGAQEIDMEEVKRLCKIVYDLGPANAAQKLAAQNNVTNYVADYVAWLDANDTNNPKVMQKYFEQMIVDLETNYDEAVAAEYGVTTSYNWYFSQNANFSSNQSINDNSAKTFFGKEKTLDLSIKPNGVYTYDYTKTTYFRCMVATSIKCSTTVNDKKLVNAGYRKNNLLYSTVITVPAMTKVDGVSATCTDAALSEAYVCPDCDGLYAIMKNGENVTVTCADGTVRKQLVPITEEERSNPNYPARGHSFNPACGNICVRCKMLIAGDRHEAANGEWVKVDNETHAHICKYCNETVANVTYHNFELVTIVPGSCNIVGTYSYVCKDCGYAQPEFKDSQLGHDWVLQEGSVEPGCTTAGTLKYKCSICNTKKTVTANPLGHQLEELDFVAQNCSENGRKHVWHCAYCDLYFSDAEASVQIAESEVIIPADGVSHVWGTEWVYGKNAHWHECELCDAVKDMTEDASPADIDAVATNLDGKVGLLFYVTMPDYVLADAGAYATLTLGTKNGDVTETQLVKDVPHSPKGSMDRWQFSYYVVSKQMHDKVTLNLYLSDGTKVPLTRKGEAVAETGYAYSIIEYCDLAIANSSNAKMVTLAKRLKAYGEMAQIYFDYLAEGLVPDADFSKDLFGGLADYAEVTSGKCPEGLVSSKPQGMVLILEEETTLRVNWKFEAGADPYSYEYMIDDAPVALQHAGSDYFLAVENISSKKLGDAHKFTISKDGKSYSWTGSALTWANSAVNKGGTNAQNMGKALYLYNQAARDYFNY